MFWVLESWFFLKQGNWLIPEDYGENIHYCPLTGVEAEERLTEQLEKSYKYAFSIGEGGRVIWLHGWTAGGSAVGSSSWGFCYLITCFLSSQYQRHRKVDSIISWFLSSESESSVRWEQYITAIFQWLSLFCCCLVTKLCLTLLWPRGL